MPIITAPNGQKYTQRDILVSMSVPQCASTSPNFSAARSLLDSLWPTDGLMCAALDTYQMRDETIVIVHRPAHSPRNACTHALTGENAEAFQDAFSRDLAALSPAERL